MDFSKYKDALLPYLRLKGIDAKEGLNRCFSPSHEDKNPSCQISENNFYCFSCGIHGDIYDAAEILQGITDRAEQFKEIENTFGGGSAAPLLPKKAKVTVKKKENFQPDAAAVQSVTAYLSRHSFRKNGVAEYLQKRAQAKTDGRLASYPDDICDGMANWLFYWPGFDAAESELGYQTLVAAGISGRNPEYNYKSSWDAAGVVFKGCNGFKLNYYSGSESVKRNGKGFSPFPMPQNLPRGQSIVFVEGEFDALACRATGIGNVFSAGGINGISKEKAEKFIVSNEIPEIIFLADNDTEKNNFIGQKMFGALPFDKSDKQQTSVPQKLLQAGYKGQIKVAVFPADSPFKDADEAVLHGRADVVKDAIKNAQPYQPPRAQTEITEKKGSSLWKDFDSISIKRLKSLLKKISVETLDEADALPFAQACFLACKNSSTEKEILNWAGGKIAADELKKKTQVTPYFILEVCEKYELSKYLTREIEKALVPTSEILRLVQEQETIVSIDYDKMENDANFLQFLSTQGIRSAALAVAAVLQGRLIFVETEKHWFFFNGHVWIREPDAPGAAYTILLNLLLKYLEKHSDQKALINELVTKIESRRFRVELSHDLAGLRPHVFRESVLFDGPQVRETLTLLDCVADFSGKEIVYRASRPDEYRRLMLPYTKEQMQNAGAPEMFMKFMKDNFKDEETLKTLLYYMSLIPSRNTGFKYGGIFLGRTGTGKSTTCNLIEAIFSGMCVRMQSNVLVSTNVRSNSGNEATPEIAKIEGMCCAFTQETARNAKLNANTWKELTGGDTLTARRLHRDPHDFIPTAQIIIASNYSPSFDGHDEATVDRMIVVPFNVQHKKKKGSKTANDFIGYLRPEFPAVIKKLMEMYIDLHVNLGGDIPLSAECQNYKNRYIEEQKTDLDKFVNDCLVFDLSGGVYLKVQDAYECYLKYYGLEAESKEALSRNKFVRFLKRDYREIDYRQKKINGYPELAFFNVTLSEQGQQTLAQTDENTQSMFNANAAPAALPPLPPAPATPAAQSEPPQPPDWSNSPPIY